MEDYDKTCLEAALQGVSNIVQQEWGSGCPCQVVLVTDGALGIGRGSLRHSLQTIKQRGEDKKFPLPFLFPSKLYVMCIASAEEVPQSGSAPPSSSGRLSVPASLSMCFIMSFLMLYL